MRILVVCGAGASSTFVAQRLRRAASARGLQHDVHATTHASLEDDLPTADVVLVGPHLAPAIAAIDALASAHGARAVLLPGDTFADRSGERTLALLQGALDTRADLGTTP